MKINYRIIVNIFFAFLLTSIYQSIVAQTIAEIMDNPDLTYFEKVTEIETNNLKSATTATE
jgi:hypothetical protein